MQPFKKFTAGAVPMDMQNIDTDQIIPARFLRKPRSAGYENWLFYDARFDNNNQPIADFVLNRSEYANAQIIVARENFGCGSSREGAVWALAGAGFRALIAPSFGDILASNSLKNGLLPIVLPSEIVGQYLKNLEENPGAQITVDLETQTVIGPSGKQASFEIDPFRKQCLLRGQDDIGITLEYTDQITAFEKQHFAEKGWLQRPPMSG